MALAGFRDTEGRCVPLAEIDYVRDAARFNSSPATLAILIDSANARRGVDFSASQLGTTTRQHVLRASDFYPPTAQAMSGHLGTLKHAQINVQRNRLIVEQRFISKRNPRISGQIDHAALVGQTDDGTFVVDLYDLKTTKWYSTTLIAKDVWKHHPDYAWQLNLCAALMEEIGVECPDCGGDGRRWFDSYDPSDNRVVENEEPCASCNASGLARAIVRNLYLECIPADSSYKHEPEAQKLGLPEFQKVIIPVERKSADETYAVYEKALALRDKAIADGYAPICEDRWSNKTISDLRCKFYCDVAAECIELAAKVGESHPLVHIDDVLESRLAASIAQAKENAQ